MHLPAPLFDPLAAMVAKRAGLRFSDRQRWLLESRVAARIAARGRGESGPAYVERLLGGDEQELALLVEGLRVGETRFFRHPRQLRALRRIALPELAAVCEAERRPLRIWSAGCASGEEAYTLVLLVAQARPSLDVEVLATDLSPEAIRAAREGRYDAERTRDVPDELRSRAFVEEARTSLVRDEVRAKVRFQTHNLLADPYPRDRDLILCRNVLIYFDAITRARVTEQLFESVRMHGYVALGYADRIGDVEGVEAIRTDEGILYRRVEERTSVMPPEPEGAPGAERPPEPRRSGWSAATSASTTSTAASTTRASSASSASGVSGVTGVTGLAGGSSESHSSTSTTASSATTRDASTATSTAARLVGELTEGAGVRTCQLALAPLLEAGGGTLDLSGLGYADDAAGEALAHAASQLRERLVLVVTSPGIERFLRRHAIAPPATLRRTA